MNWHVIVRAAISQAIGRCGLSRQALVRVYVCLYGELPARADRLRRRREPADPDHFLYRVVLLDAGAWHVLTFRVDDVSALLTSSLGEGREIPYP